MRRPRRERLFRAILAGVCGAGLRGAAATSAHGAGLGAEGASPPLFNITASSLYEAGQEHGWLAGERIQAWLASEEVGGLLRFTQNGAGRAAYEQLRHDSSAAFPRYADELRGIAEGAGVELDTIWAGVLMIELESLMEAGGADHCSDISAISSGGYKGGLAHGHNEDWSAEVRELYYYVKYTAAPGADFASCAGLAYPGALIGWAPTWNARGIFMTVNTLFPRRVRPSGVSTAFVQRDAICGRGRNLGDLDAVISGLAYPGWSDGASVNLVDTIGRAMANVEVYQDQHDVLRISAAMGNYSHFNRYKRLVVQQSSKHMPSTVERERYVDSLPAPRTRGDVARLLADAPLLRNSTIATLLLDDSGRLEAWAGASPVATQPIHSWSLGSFFYEPEIILVV